MSHDALATLPGRAKKTAAERDIALDGYRGVAVLGVLLWHSCVILLDLQLPVFRQIYMCTFVLRSGVDMFFVLSGFLITRILLRERMAENYFRAFYARRFFRIGPLYYAFVALLVVARLCGSSSPLFAGSAPLWSYFFLLQDYLTPTVLTSVAPLLGVAWSLAVEEQFYLIWPALVRHIRIPALPWIIVSLMVTANILRWILSAMGPAWSHVSHVWGVCRVDSLLIGAGIAYLEKYRGSVLVQVRNVTRPVILLLMMFIPLSGPFLAGHVDIGMARWGYLFFGLIYGVLLCHSLQSDSFVSTVLKLRPLRWCGTISYGIYLFQCPVLQETWRLAGREMKLYDLSGLGLSALGVVITLVLAKVSFEYFERPLIEYGRRHGRYA